MNQSKVSSQKSPALFDNVVNATKWQISKETDIASTYHSLVSVMADAVPADVTAGELEGLRWRMLVTGWWHPFLPLVTISFTNVFVTELFGIYRA